MRSWLGVLSDRRNAQGAKCWHEPVYTVIFLCLVLLTTPIWAQNAPPEGSPEWAKRQNELATLSARRGFWEEAAFRWMLILRYYPNWARIWNNLAIAMEAQGEWELAEKYYQRAIKLDPQNQDIRANFLRFRTLKRRFSEELSSNPDKKGKNEENKNNKNETDGSSSNDLQRPHMSSFRDMRFVQPSLHFQRFVMSMTKPEGGSGE